MRWPNILRVTPSQHVLCDFECATKIIPNRNKSHEKKTSINVLSQIMMKAPEADITGGTDKTDIYLVGQLLSLLPNPFMLSPPATKFRNQLTDPDPTCRPSVDDALKNTFLA